MDHTHTARFLSFSRQAQKHMEVHLTCLFVWLKAFPKWKAWLTVIQAQPWASQNLSLRWTGRWEELSGGRLTRNHPETSCVGNITVFTPTLHYSQCFRYTAQPQTQSHICIHTFIHTHKPALCLSHLSALSSTLGHTPSQSLIHTSTHSRQHYWHSTTVISPF